MSSIEWTVIIGGLFAMAWVNWYFCLAQASADNQVQSQQTGNTTGTPR